MAKGDAILPNSVRCIDSVPLTFYKLNEQGVDKPGCEELTGVTAL